MNQVKTKEQEIEQGLINRLEELKYTYRPDISDREALERNFRQKFEALNRVRLTDARDADRTWRIVSVTPEGCLATSKPSDR